MTRPSQEIGIGLQEVHIRRGRFTRREFIGAATAMVTSAVLPSADLMGEIPQSNNTAFALAQ